MEQARRHLRERFPGTTVLDAWLEPCVQYLSSTYGYDNAASASALCRDVEEQLMLSDLSTSVAPSLPPLSSFAKDAPVVLRGTYLVQVVGLDDAAKPAHDLLNTLKEQEEAANRAAVKAERTYNMDDVERDERANDRVGDGQQHDDEEDAPREFGRGSARLVLSDGKTTIKAFERKRVEGLGLSECKLGAKVLLRDAVALNDLVLLEPATTTVLGHQVEELEDARHELLRQTWEERLRAQAQQQPMQV